MLIAVVKLVLTPISEFSSFIDTLIKIRKYTICSMEFMNPGMEPKCIRIAGWISFAEEILVFSAFAFGRLAFHVGVFGQTLLLLGFGAVVATCF